MKKAIIALLLIILVVSLSACSKDNTKDIQTALQGTWIGRWSPLPDVDGYQRITFKGNEYNDYVKVGAIESGSTGKIEIKESEILCIHDDDSKTESYDYTYNEKTGELILWRGSIAQLKKE